MRVLVLTLAGLLACSRLACSPSPSTAGRARAALDPTPNAVWVRRDRGALTVSDHVRMVYDQGRSQVLVATARPNAGVHAWNGADWEPLADAPQPRFYLQGAAYDATRHQTVLFGGVDGDSTSSTSLDQTWLFGASGFVRAASGPARRAGPAMAFDAARDRVLLTGGSRYRGATAIDETWVWDGETWTNAMVSGPASVWAGIAYDARREVVVLVQPVDGSSETWEWDGSTWTTVPAETPLPNSYQYDCAWDPDRGQVLALVEGAVWGWAGSTWVRVDNDDGNATARRFAAIEYDTSRGRAVVRGAGALTWELEGSTWTSIQSSKPTARLSAPGVYDVARGVTVYFGGNAATTGGDGEDETWEWTGDAWIRGPVGPAIAYDPPMGYDRARSRVVVVGNDGHTWEYDGTRWSDRGPTDARISMMAFDEMRGVMVGLGPSTWTYDGTTWTDTMATSPPTVRDSALAYDAARGRVVRFGGYTDGTGDSQIDETWEWDGTSWTMVTPAMSPAPSGGHVSTYDRRRERVLIYGGYRSTTMWEYDGSTWLAREVVGATPPGAFPNGLAYDEARDVTVFYAPDGSLWEYFPVGEPCAESTECTSGFCVAGVCCDRACNRGCEACSIATGSTNDGVCEALPDAGTACDDPPDGGAGAGPGGGGPGSERGGCCSAAGSANRPDAPTAIVLALALGFFVRRRMRR